MNRSEEVGMIVHTRNFL